MQLGGVSLAMLPVSNSGGKRTLTLNTGASTTLNGSGDGSVVMGPNVGQRWRLELASVLVLPQTSSLPVPQVKLYMGSGQPIETEFVDGSNTGNLNASDSVSRVPLGPNQKILAVWTNGPPGARATLSIVGTQEI